MVFCNWKYLTRHMTPYLLCLHTFIFFWLRKISVTVEMYELSFRVLFWFCSCLSFGDLFILLVRISPFYFYFYLPINICIWLLLQLLKFHTHEQFYGQDTVDTLVTKSLQIYFTMWLNYFSKLFTDHPFVP